MMNKTQLNELERRLWAECPHGQAYEALLEAIKAREMLENLVNATYAVLNENRRHVKDSYKLEKLEMLLCMAEETLQ